MGKNKKQSPKKKNALKRTRLRRRSKKTEEKYVDRRALVKKILSERPLCEACKIFAKHEGKVTYNHHLSRDLHEIVRRSQGGSILDESNILAVCRPCHVRITANPELAFSLGLAKRSWEK